MWTWQMCTERQRLYARRPVDARDPVAQSVARYPVAAIGPEPGPHMYHRESLGARVLEERGDSIGQFVRGRSYGLGPEVALQVDEDERVPAPRRRGHRAPSRYRTSRLHSSGRKQSSNAAYPLGLSSPATPPTIPSPLPKAGHENPGEQSLELSRMALGHRGVSAGRRLTPSAGQRWPAWTAVTGPGGAG